MRKSTSTVLFEQIDIWKIALYLQLPLSTLRTLIFNVFDTNSLLFVYPFHLIVYFVKPKLKDNKPRYFKTLEVISKCNSESFNWIILFLGFAVQLFIAKELFFSHLLKGSKRWFSVTIMTYSSLLLLLLF